MRVNQPRHGDVVAAIYRLRRDIVCGDALPNRGDVLADDDDVTPFDNRISRVCCQNCGIGDEEVSLGLHACVRGELVLVIVAATVLPTPSKPGFED